MTEQFDLFERVERLSPAVFERVKGVSKVICANVDFYSGFVYDMLGLSSDLYTQFLLFHALPDGVLTVLKN